MKSEKGITLVSLTVYLIAMTIVVAIVAVISRYFYTNTKTIGESVDHITEYTQFNSFFSDEVNHENIKVLECKTNYENSDDMNSKVINSYIVFDNGVQYTFINENQGVYRNNVKISSGVEKCTFENVLENGKMVVKVNFKVKEKSRETTYILKT